MNHISPGGALMGGLIALVGGDEFRPGCEDMDRAILAASGVPHPSVQIVPTAAAFENPSKAASNGVAYFTRLGGEASALMVLGPADANDGLKVAPVDSADVIFLTGGSPTHLLDTLSESLLLQAIRRALDRGAVVTGSSAGAMVLGPWMRFSGWRQTLGLVPRIVTLPHHESSHGDAVAGELASAAPPDVVALGIDGKTGCLGHGNEWQVLGNGAVTVYQSGHWQTYTAGDTLVMDPASTQDP